MTPLADSKSPDRQTLPEVALDHPILFFDGVCGLCSRAVDFVISRDPHGLFRFAPLQGETARQLLTARDLDALETMVVATRQGVYRRSSAAIQVLSKLGPGWQAAGWALWMIPRPVRDAGYHLIARSRYRLFGKHESCRLPTPEERERFLP